MSSLNEPFFHWRYKNVGSQEECCQHHHTSPWKPRKIVWDRVFQGRPQLFSIIHSHPVAVERTCSAWRPRRTMFSLRALFTFLFVSTKWEIWLGRGRILFMRLESSLLALRFLHTNGQHKSSVNWIMILRRCHPRDVGRQNDRKHVWPLPQYPRTKEEEEIFADRAIRSQKHQKREKKFWILILP